MDLTEVIKEIRKIIGNEYNDLNITIYNNDIVFKIYEIEVPLTVNRCYGTVSLDCELYEHELTPDVLEEITQIAKILEKNVKNILKIYEK